MILFVNQIFQVGDRLGRLAGGTRCSTLAPSSEIFIQKAVDPQRVGGRFQIRERSENRGLRIAKVAEQTRQEDASMFRRAKLICMVEGEHVVERF